MVEDKIHARAVWPYALITQQPLWWKARDWWQRFGEMEVWALEAYSAVHTLQEMLTIKSDDIVWRNKTYEAIVKNKPIKTSWLPESFNYLKYILKWLAQDVQQVSKDEMEDYNQEKTNKIQMLNLSWLTWSFLDPTEEIEAEINEDDKEDMVKTILQEMEESDGDV